MNNPQGTPIPYIAGLMDGDGTFSLTVYKQRNKRKNTRICIGFANSSRKIIQTMINFLKENHINFYIFTRNRKKTGRKYLYQIEVTGYHSKLKLLGMITSYLSKNKEFAELFREFCEYKLGKYEEWKEKGAGIKQREGFINETKENEFYQRYKKIRDASETTSRTPHKFEVKI